jgi:putative ABC transport system permease protein
MRILLSTLRRLLAPISRRQADASLAEELRAHLQADIDDRLRAGIPPDRARRDALLALGGVVQTEEAVRDCRSFPWLEQTMLDVRYALRMLLKTPAFTLVAIATLALGIGANTAIFSLVSAVLLRPLPFPNPDRLMIVWDDMRARGGPATVEASPADFAAWRERSRSFTDLAALGTVTYNLTGSGEPKKLLGIRTTANLFTVLGMQPVLGRTLLPDDDLPESNPAVVIGERLWRSTFGAERSVAGRVITLNGLPYTVVGVVPQDFPFPSRNADLWVAAKFTPAELALNSGYFLDVIARLKPGVDQAAAQAEMSGIAAQLARDLPQANSGVGISLTPLHDQLTQTARPAISMLLGAVGLVLLIACVNVANLLLARTASRQREMALRKSLGASHARVVRQVLLESALLAVIGAAVGAACSRFTFAYLTRLVPNGLPSGTHPTLDGTALLFTAGLASLVVMLFGAGPALAARRVSLDAVLRAGAQSSTASPRAARLRHLMAISEITLTMLLLVGAGLLLQSYANVLAAPPGFDPTGLLVVETVLSPSKYETVTTRSAFCDRVLEGVRALPSVVGAGYVNFPPLVFKGGRAYFSIEGQPDPPPTDQVRNMAVDRAASPGYLETLGVSLQQGRYLDRRDRIGAPLTAVVNEQFARLHWGEHEAVGQRIKLGGLGMNAPWLTVVGVVGNVRQTALDAPVEPEVYMPTAQIDAPVPFMWPQHLVIRVAGDPLALAPAVRRVVAAIDPDQPISNIQSMGQILDAEVLDRNTQMVVVAVFAVLALLMASIGLYGVLSYGVAQRAPEIGVRIALGAEPRTITRMIIVQGAAMALIGIIAGTAASVAVGRVLSSLLYQVSPYDGRVFAISALTLAAVTLVACWLPARRAARVDPLVALRMN